MDWKSVRTELASVVSIKRILSSDLTEWLKGRADATLASIKKSLRGFQRKKQPGAKDGFRVDYAFGQYSFGYGRLYARGSSLQFLPSDVRNFIAGSYYHDIDVKNCLPTLVQWLFSSFQLPCPELDDYVENRPALLRKYKMDKLGVICLFFDKNAQPKNDLFRAIHAAIYGKLVPLLKEHERWKPLWDKVSKSKASEHKENREGSFLSLVAFTIENGILVTMVECLRELGYCPDSLIFDGVLVRRIPGQTVDDALLRKVEAKVLETHGISITLVEKPMEVSETFLAAVDKGNATSIVHGLPGYENFDMRRLTHPSQQNLAEWFLEVKKRSILGHPSSGIMFILGNDNIWRMFEKVLKTNLNIQIAQALVAEMDHILALAQDAGKATEDLEEFYENVRGKLENSDGLRVAENVERNLHEQSSDTTSDLFISKPHLLAFSDGVYDLDKSEFRPIEPDDYVLFTTGYPFPKQRNPEVRARIQAFYDSIFDSEEIRDFRLLTVASCLYGAILDEVFFVLKGNARNGKGCEDKLISNAFGNFYYTLHKNNLTQESKETDKPNPQMFNCYGKRYISVSETSPKDKLRIAPLKGLSAGDPVTVRTLHGKPITFRPTGPLNIQTNEIPVVEKLDDGSVTRARIVEYPFTFRDYEDLKNKVKKIDLSLKGLFGSPAFRDEFMLMLLDIYKAKYKDTKRLVYPREVMRYTQVNLAGSLSIGDWFNREFCITGDENDRFNRTELHNLYKAAHPSSELSPQKFYKELDAFLKQGHDSKNGRHFVGLRQKTDEDKQKEEDGDQ